MTSESLLIVLSALISVALLRPSFARARTREQLRSLAALEPEPEDHVNDTRDWTLGASVLRNLGDRLGRAGFVEEGARRNARRFTALAVSGLSIGGSLIGFRYASLVGMVAGAIIGAYLAIVVCAVLLRRFERDHEREVYFQAPLFLESLILLVESGLGVLPALEQTIRARTDSEQDDVISRVFRIVYQLSSRGFALGQALELVADSVPHKLLRHVMLHIDLSGSEGGELIPSLRSLSDYAHNEWRLAVEHRVKRLENLVVFPVFASVIGLMLLIAAVPAVPLLDLREILERGKNMRKIPALSDYTSSPQGRKGEPL